LPPGLDTVSVFDLIDYRSGLSSIQKDSVGLAPSPACLVLELDPRGFKITQPGHAESKQAQMLLDFSLIADADSLGTACSLSRDEWRLSIE
jgi:hypothetical protein